MLSELSLELRTLFTGKNVQFFRLIFVYHSENKSDKPSHCQTSGVNFTDRNNGTNQPSMIAISEYRKFVWILGNSNLFNNFLRKLFQKCFCLGRFQRP